MEDVGVPSASRQAGKTARGRSDSHSGILHVLKTGCRWRDVPPAYGPPMTIYNRYNRWSQRRIWQRIFEKMAAAGERPLYRSRRRDAPDGVVMSGWRPLIKGYFAVAR